MSRPFARAHISANDLLSGRVVYLTADLGWSGKRSDAALFQTREEAEHRLDWAQSQAAHVIGAILVPLAGPHLRAARDRIRDTGPFSLANPRTDAGA